MTPGNSIEMLVAKLNCWKVQRVRVFLTSQHIS